MKASSYGPEAPGRCDAARVAGGPRRRDRDLLGAQEKHGRVTDLRAAGPNGQAETRASHQDEPAVGGRDHRSVDEIRLADELRDESGARRFVEIERRSELLDAAAVHDGDPIGQGQGLLLVVGHVDHGDAEAFVQVLQLELHLGAELLVQRPEGLVHEKHRRLEDEGAGQGDPLLLAARELARIATAETLEPYQRERPRDALADPSREELPHPEGKSEVLGHRHVREERVVLEDHPHISLERRIEGDRSALDQDVALGGDGESGDARERRRLAGAGRPEQREELARPDRQGDAVDGPHCAEGLDDSLQPDLGALRR